LGKKTTLELANFLAKRGIGTIGSDYIEFESLDKMRAAMLAIQMGADIENLARVLNWKDFEMLATNILDVSGYIACHGLRLKDPRVEIDVVGIKDQMALLIDCKHWKHTSPSELKRFALMQIDRAEAFVRANERKIRFAVPAILTLHLESITFADGVPVIPMIKFRSFLNEINCYLNEVRKVTLSI